MANWLILTFVLKLLRWKPCLAWTQCPELNHHSESPDIRGPVLKIFVTCVKAHALLRSLPCHFDWPAEWTSVEGPSSLADGQPRGESTRARVQNVRQSRSGSNQSDGVRLGDSAHEGMRGQCPRIRFSYSLLIRARPWLPQFCHGLPGPARRGSRQSISNVFLLTH